MSADVTALAQTDGIAPGWQLVGDGAELAAAWVAALGELEDVARGREAVVETKAGGSYRYRYADLGDVLSQARAVLARHGLAVFQPAQVLGDDVVVSTTVMHTSGAHLVFAPFVLPAGNTAQATGSSITYSRRYALMSILGLATDDDDGATAGVRRDTPGAPVLLAWSTVTRFLGAAAEAGLDDDDIGAVVSTATGGRTTDPRAVWADERDALRAALDAASPPAGDAAGETDPPSTSTTALMATRAQLATLDTLERRAGLGLARLDVVRAVIGRDADTGDLSRHEADQLLAAFQGIADGTTGLTYRDDGVAELVTIETTAPAIPPENPS